jgi:hypothetical protein
MIGAAAVGDGTPGDGRPDLGLVQHPGADQRRRHRLDPLEVPVDEGPRPPKHLLVVEPVALHQFVEKGQVPGRAGGEASRCRDATVTAGVGALFCEHPGDEDDRVRHRSEVAARDRAADDQPAVGLADSTERHGRDPRAEELRRDGVAGLVHSDPGAVTDAGAGGHGYNPTDAAAFASNTASPRT